MSTQTTKTVKEIIYNIEKEGNDLFEIINHPKNYNSEDAHLLSIVLRDMREHISYIREHNYLFGSL